MPTPAELHPVEPLLTNMSLAYMQELSAFLAGRIFPVVPVATSSGTFATYPKGSFWRDEMRPRPLGGEAEIADYTVGTDTYAVEEWAVKHRVDDRTRANALNPFSPDDDATFLLSQMAAINAERRWATSFFGTGIWGTDLTGVAAAPAGGQFLRWDVSTSDPAHEIRTQSNTMEAATGFGGNVLVVGADVWLSIQNNAQIKDIIKYTERGVIGEQLVASLMGLDDFIVARSVYNSAAEGAADSIARLIGAKDALLIHRTPRPGLKVPTAGTTFAWQNLVPGATNLLSAVIERRRIDTHHSDEFEIRNAFGYKVVASDLGIFFSGAVS